MKTSRALACQKHLFSIPEGVHYLNCAYMSPLSKAVEAAGVEGIKQKSLPTRISTEDFFSHANTARALFAKLVNGQAERVAIIPAASYGIATVARNLKVSKGQNIVMLHEQFPSNVYSWRKFEDRGAKLKMVQPPSTSTRIDTKTSNRAEAWNARILEAINADTAVVTLPHIHWTDGTVFDLEGISQKARAVGAALIIDGTQSVGALPFDLQTIQADALIVAGYKCMMGPYGIGFAYYGSHFDEGEPLEENWIGRKDSENFSDLVHYQDDYAAGAVRYDVGERANPILLPMMIQALREVLEREPARIQSYCHSLMQDAITELETLGYRVENKARRAAHLFGVRLPQGLEPNSLKNHLATHHIAVSIRGDAVRVSPNVYNDGADVLALTDVLKRY